MHSSLEHRSPWWFVVRDANRPGLRLLQPRWALSWLRGPMTRSELRRARSGWGPVEAAEGHEGDLARGRPEAPQVEARVRAESHP